MGYKIAYNDCSGSFTLSNKALDLGRELSGNPEWARWNIDRHNLVLVEVVERLGKAASGPCANIKIIEIDSPIYRIEGCNGLEKVVTHDNIKWTVIEDLDEKM